MLCFTFAARAAARSRATFSWGVSSERLAALKGEFVGGWYEKVDAAEGLEDA